MGWCVAVEKSVDTYSHVDTRSTHKIELVFFAHMYDCSWFIRVRCLFVCVYCIEGTEDKEDGKKIYPIFQKSPEVS